MNASNLINSDTSFILNAVLQLLGTLLFVFLATTGGKTALSIGISYAVSSYAAAPISGASNHAKILFWAPGCLPVDRSNNMRDQVAPRSAAATSSMQHNPE